jgi:hypothetical protein
MPANDDVIIADETGQSANGQDDRERGVLRGEESRADDIGFAGAPIAVKQGGGASPTDVAGPM